MVQLDFHHGDKDREDLKETDTREGLDLATSVVSLHRRGLVSSLDVLLQVVLSLGLEVKALQ